MAKIQTVLGAIEPSQLGVALTHEHFALDFNAFYSPAPPHLEEYLNNKITLQNVGILKQYPYGSRYNVSFFDNDTHAAVYKDVELYKKYGGGAIVENTTHGLLRDLSLMTRVSKETGVHVVAGTGHYCAIVQPPSVLATSYEDMCKLITRELTENCDGPGGENIKCGLIGEVGSAWPIHDFERRAIQATGFVQEALGCGVSFHPGRDKAAPFEIIRLHLEAGGKADKTVMSHLDRTLLDVDDLLEFAALGCYCQFDLFGTECSYYQLNPSTDMPSDAQRLNYILKLLEEGREDKILMSHDVHTKHRLIEFGGHGYSHIINNIFPKMLLKGISKEIIEKISIENPRTWLEYKY